MGVRFYDEAITAKFQKWIKQPGLSILKPEETTRLFQVKADQNNDKPIKLPMIALSRDPNLPIKHSKKTPLSFDGVRVEQNEHGTLHLDAIPIEPSYQLDIYTRKFQEGDEYLRNFIFQITNHPKFEIEIPYNSIKLHHIAYLELEDTAQDNSDIPLKLFPDEFTRWTLKFKVRDAYMFSAPISENANLELGDLEVITENPPVVEIEEINYNKK